MGKQGGSNRTIIQNCLNLCTFTPFNLSNADLYIIILHPKREELLNITKE